MDADYGRNRDRDGEPTKTFEPSLFVWATVMSRPAGDRAIVDAGLKALAFDSGPPLVCDEPAATYERASDEHGRLAVAAATNRLALGDKIRLIPGHCDPTVNLYDWYVCIRNNRVEQLWPITARGAVYGCSARCAKSLGRTLRELQSLANIVDPPAMPAPVARNPSDNPVLPLAGTSQADLTTPPRRWSALRSLCGRRSAPTLALGQASQDRAM
jgi:hypothetical protein